MKKLTPERQRKLAIQCRQLGKVGRDALYELYFGEPPKYVVRKVNINTTT